MINKRSLIRLLLLSTLILMLWIRGIPVLAGFYRHEASRNVEFMTQAALQSDDATPTETLAPSPPPPTGTPPPPPPTDTPVPPPPPPTDTPVPPPPTDTPPPPPPTDTPVPPPPTDTPPPAEVTLPPPTDTPLPPPTETPAPTAAVAETEEPTATPPPAEVNTPTATAVGFETPESLPTPAVPATATPSPTTPPPATNTPLPVDTATATHTPLPTATATYTPLPTATATAMNPLPPPATATATNTPLPPVAPTVTGPLPPTTDWSAVPTPLPCLETPQPMDVMLVLDRSDSLIGRPFDNARLAVERFIDQIDLSISQVGLVAFDGTATLDHPLTQDGQAVKVVLQGLTIGDRTNIAGGIRQAQAELTGPRHRSGYRPVIILLSDGEQSNNGEDPLAEANVAKNGGTRLITIALGERPRVALMQAMASSPADYYLASSDTDLLAIYYQIVETIRVCGGQPLEIEAEMTNTTNAAAPSVNPDNNPTYNEGTSNNEGEMAQPAQSQSNEEAAQIDLTQAEDSHDVDAYLELPPLNLFQIGLAGIGRCAQIGQGCLEISHNGNHRSEIILIRTPMLVPIPILPINILITP